MREHDRASALALVELAKGAAPRAGRPTVLLSVSDAALAGADGAEDVAVLSTGGLVGIETAQRYCCDASLQVVYKDTDGTPTSLGRAAPNIPPPMRRAVFERDGGMCTFEGCEIDAYLECHHILPRAQHGQNVVSNLITTCWIHHTLLHEWHV